MSFQLTERTTLCTFSNIVFWVRFKMQPNKKCQHCSLVIALANVKSRCCVALSIHCWQNRTWQTLLAFHFQWAFQESFQWELEVNVTCITCKFQLHAKLNVLINLIPLSHFVICFLLIVLTHATSPKTEACLHGQHIMCVCKTIIVVLITSVCHFVCGMFLCLSICSCCKTLHVLQQWCLSH